MEILSFGNKIRVGEYKIHSRFNSAVNFISGDTFVFVVNESVGAGPVNIVVNGIIPQSLESVEIEDSCIKLADTKYNIGSIMRYDSSIDLSKYDYELFALNLGIVEKVVVEKAPGKSLSFLLKKGEQEGFSGFEAECRRIFKAGAEQVLYGDVITGVKMIRGLGPGLTPSGDDFNSGLLIALNLVKKTSNCHPRGSGDPMFVWHSPACHSREESTPTCRGGNPFDDIENLISRVYTAAKGKNLFTNSFLQCAASGNVFIKFRKLLNALLHSNVKEIINSTELVMSMGETSGADQLTGFLIGMKRFLK
jgi:hypothetical protein